MKRWEIKDLRPLGPTGQQVVPIGMGTHGLGHAFGLLRSADDLRQSVAVLASTVPEGGRALVDVAPRYGHGSVESWIGSSEWDSRLLLATKGGRHIEAGRDNQKDFSEGFLRYDLGGSLRRLQRDSVFLYQMHNPSEDVVRAGEVFGILERLRGEGLIEWYGFSVDNAREAIAVLETYESLKCDGLASIQLIHSFATKFESLDLVGRAASTGVALIAREVLCRGLFTENSLDFDNETASAVRKLIDIYGRSQLENLREDARRVVVRYGVSLSDAAIGYSMLTKGITVTLVGVTRSEEARDDLRPRDQMDASCFAELDALPNLARQ